MKKENRLINIILKAIPVIGVLIFFTGVVCFLLFIWGFNPLLNMKITSSSIVVVLLLKLIESSLK